MSQGNESQENDEEMRPEYDIRGGVRGKYLARYTEARLQLQESPWTRLPSTESRGDHAGESTVHIGAEPLYQTARIEVGAPAAQ